MNNLYLVYIFSNMIDDVLNSKIDLAVKFAVNKGK